MKNSSSTTSYANLLLTKALSFQDDTGVTAIRLSTGPSVCFAVGKPAKVPSSKPKEDFLMTVVCDTVNSGISDGWRNLFEVDRSKKMVERYVVFFLSWTHLTYLTQVVQVIPLLRSQCIFEITVCTLYRVLTFSMSRLSV